MSPYGSAVIVAAAGSFAVALWELAVRAARRRHVVLRGTVIRPLAAALTATAGAAASGRADLVVFACGIAGACVCAATDLETGLIFDDVTAATLYAAFSAAIVSGVAMQAAFGALAAAGCLAAIRVATRGVGWGDVKLAACIGAALGPSEGVLSLGIAFVIGGLVGAALLASGRARRHSKIAFGPFLAFGLVAAGVPPCCR